MYYIVFGDAVDVACAKCRTKSTIPDQEIPVGRSFMVCPQCQARINIFKGFPVGAIVQNLSGLRFLRNDGELCEHYCEPGELWRVVDVISPCPDKGRGRSCEADNSGRCPNQRIILRLRRDKILYKTCLYRKGRRIFDSARRTAVGQQPTSSSIFPDDDDTTYRVR